MKFPEGKFVEEFFERTVKNLEYYDSQNKSNSEKCFYEVTQLINSLLGLVVFINENKHPLQDLIYKNFEKKVIVWDYPNEEQNSKSLIRHLRNSISHARIEANGRGEHIESINFKDKNGNSRFEIELSIKEIRELINMIRIKHEVVR